MCVALPIPVSVRSIFLCPNFGVRDCQCLGSLTCVQMLMHAIGVRDCQCLGSLTCVQMLMQAIGVRDCQCLGSLTCVQMLMHAIGVRDCQCLGSLTCVQMLMQAIGVRDCQCLGSLTCVQMLMQAIAHGGCTDTVRQSALEADCGRKIPFRTGDSNLSQYCSWLFSRTLYQLNQPRLYLVAFAVHCVVSRTVVQILTCDLTVTRVLNLRKNKFERVVCPNITRCG